MKTSLLNTSMSFQAYINTIQTKTGLLPEDFKKIAITKGFIVNGVVPKTVKATQVINWLKEDYGLGQGHAMAIYATFKGKNGPTNATK